MTRCWAHNPVVTLYGWNDVKIQLQANNLESIVWLLAEGDGDITSQTRTQTHNLLILSPVFKVTSHPIHPFAEKVGSTEAASSKDLQLGVVTAELVEVKTEVSVQANDYEIERATGILPARKRFIPFKYR